MAKFSIFRLIFSKGQRRTKKPSLSIKGHAHNKRPTETGEPLLCQRALTFMAYHKHGDTREKSEPGDGVSLNSPCAEPCYKSFSSYMQSASLRETSEYCLEVDAVCATDRSQHEVFEIWHISPKEQLKQPYAYPKRTSRSHL